MKSGQEMAFSHSEEDPENPAIAFSQSAIVLFDLILLTPDFVEHHRPDNPT